MRREKPAASKTSGSLRTPGSRPESGRRRPRFEGASRTAYGLAGTGRGSLIVRFGVGFGAVEQALSPASIAAASAPPRATARSIFLVMIEPRPPPSPGRAVL